MLAAECALLVVSLLIACCHAEEAKAEGGSGDEEVEAKGRTFGLNSTNNMTHFTYGIVANLAAMLLYGSNFVPVKRVETGDGMFFQWVYCAAIWSVAMVGDVMLHSPKFYPLAMLGGVIWATGSVMAVPIVKAIGLSLGVLIWGSSSLLIGWATPRFGWFGIPAEDVLRPMLNYCGVGLCLLSSFIFFFVKTDLQQNLNPESVPLLIDRHTSSGSYGLSLPKFWIDSVRPSRRRLIGCLLAMVSGVLYGSSFTPMLYIKSHSSRHDSMFHGASLYDLDYVYAQCCGIFVASTVYFIIYCVAMKSRPRLYSRVILPGLFSGSMWALATYCWVLANNYLSVVVTCPMVTAGYSLVAALWGSLVFKEIKGLVNCLIFSLASSMVLMGSLLTAISNL
ncbi:transmembrane protein 144b isoform X1 [Corythoichthys intestinalis]|uniref:transmembrane protein 144b isoform X1 n=1 Tax=Corythoichthys intestinalis TaxID=161448 RepID=UPI0025A61F90|nr:transmembrane protein 144b isoform X1 [Corythoichthys intestinalis]